MQPEILTTKLYIPPTGQNVIYRSRLVDQLDKGSDKKIIILSAPAGYGKTTLLSQWLSRSTDPVAWVTLDSNDNDPGRFLAYFIASLRSAGLEIDPEILTLRQSNPKTPIDSILIPVINQIASSSEPVTFVLDDYHKIQAPDVHDAVAYLLDHLPNGLQVVIATRADPPLPIARLRARGELVEVRVEDLRFTLHESGEFLNQQSHLSPDQVQAVTTRTEGWVAGLQLLSLSLHGKQNKDDYINSFSGTQEYIADFLATEVLNQQDETVRDVLIRTSILDRISASLIGAVTGYAHSQELLKRLKDGNVFLIPLDDRNQWFRYHHLFADLLHQRLLGAYPEQIPEIQLKASRWFQRNGHYSEAIEYALRGGHFEQAAELINGQAENFLIRGEVATFVNWTQMLPEEIILKTGTLSLYCAWALILYRGDMDKAARYLDRFTPGNDSERGKKNTVQSMLSAFRQNIPGSNTQARRALAQLPRDEFFFRQIAAWHLSASLFLQGNHQEGSRTLREVVRVALANNNHLVAVIAMTRLGAVQFQKGHLNQAQALFERAIEIKPAGRNSPLPAACDAMLNLGKVYWERFDLEKALDFLENGLALSAGWSANSRIDAYCTLAHVQQEQGDHHRAFESLAEAKRFAVQNSPTQMDERFVELQNGLICLREGKMTAVADWIHRMDLEAKSQNPVLESSSRTGDQVILAYELIVYSRYLIDQDRGEMALNILDQILPLLKQMQQEIKRLEAEVIAALAHFKLGNRQEAAAAIDSVLQEAGPLGCRRIFLEEGSTMTELLKLWEAMGHSSAFGMELLASLFVETERASNRNQPAGNIEPLTRREIAVLRLLDSELSVPEMSDLLHIATSTVRTHIKNIYAKLDVHSRFEAVSRAKDHHLL